MTEAARLISYKVRSDGKPPRSSTSFPVDSLDCVSHDPDEYEPGIVRLNIAIASRVMALSLTDEQRSALIAALQAPAESAK